MGEIKFKGMSEETHHCTSYREGEWIVWRCPHCERYERRLNAVTGEMRTNRGGSEARHTGTNSQQQNLEALTRNLHMN